MGLAISGLYLAAVIATPLHAGPQERPSAEARAYIATLADIGDHGRPPQTTRMDVSATCDDRPYRIVLTRAIDPEGRGRTVLDSLEQPQHPVSPQDRDRFQAVLDRFDIVSQVELHCWRSAGYRYTLTGHTRHEDGVMEKTATVSFNGDGRFDRVVE